MVGGTAVGLAKAPGDVAVTQAGVVLVIAREIVCSVIHLKFKRFSIEYIILPSASILSLYHISLYSNQPSSHHKNHLFRTSSIKARVYSSHLRAKSGVLSVFSYFAISFI